MNKKIKKNLLLPEWLADQLDFAGDLYGGPGVVAAASILSFCKMSKTKKKETLKNYRENEIEYAYAEEDETAAASPSKAGKHTRKGLGPSKVGRSL